MVMVMKMHMLAVHLHFVQVVLCFSLLLSGFDEQIQRACREITNSKNRKKKGNKWV